MLYLQTEPVDLQHVHGTNLGRFNVSSHSCMSDTRMVGALQSNRHTYDTLVACM